MKQIEAVIFDWAGTTVDYGCMAPVYAMQDAFSQQRVAVSQEEIRQPMGMLKADHIKAVLEMERVSVSFKQLHGRMPTVQDIESIYQRFESNIMTNLHQHAELIDGVLSVQEYLRTHQIKIGSTTGYTKNMLDIVARNAHEQGYKPDWMIAADQVTRGRPYPYMLFQNLNALDIRDVNTVVKVGDTIVDIQEALHAGCWAVGVIQGGSILGLSAEEIAALDARLLKEKIHEVKYAMLAAGAHFVIDSIAELPWVIEAINQVNSRRKSL